MTNETIDFCTDAAMLALSDLSIVIDNDETFPPQQFPQSRKIAYMSLGGDGCYRARVTDGKLSTSERIIAIGVFDNLGVEITTGQLWIGAGEFLADKHQSGCIIPLQNGQYTLSIYALLPEDKIADIVIILNKAEKNFQQKPITEEPYLFGMDHDGYLFGEGPPIQLDLTLTRKVRSTKRTESSYIINDADCNWPFKYGDYDVLLEDMSNVKRGDRISFKTTRVDEDNKIIYAQQIT